jgi:hypothetical protein
MRLYNLILLLFNNNKFTKHTILPITNKISFRKYNNTNAGYDMTKNDTEIINFREIFKKKYLLDKLVSNISLYDKIELIKDNDIKVSSLCINTLLLNWYYDL